MNKKLSNKNRMRIASALLGACLLTGLGSCSVAIKHNDSEMAFSLTRKKTNKSCFPFKDVEEVHFNTPSGIILNGVDHVQTTPSRIFVQDYNDNLYSFDRQGNYICQFSCKGQGPEEYIRLSAFAVTPAEEVYLYDCFKKQFLVYDFDGNFKNVVKMDAETNAEMEQMEYLIADRFAVANDIFNTDNNVYGIVNLTDRKIDTFATVPLRTVHTLVPIGSHSMDVYNNNIVYLKPFDPVIYMYPDKEYYEIPTTLRVWDEEDQRKIEDFSIFTYTEVEKEGVFRGYMDIFELENYIFLGFSNLDYALINKSDRSITEYEYRKDDSGRHIGVNKIIGRDGDNRLIGIKNNMTDDIEELFFYTLPDPN